MSFGGSTGQQREGRQANRNKNGLNTRNGLEPASARDRPRFRESGEPRIIGYLSVMSMLRTNLWHSMQLMVMSM